MFLDREAASAFISEKDNLSGGGFQSQVRDQLNPDPMRQDFAMVCHALAASPICGWVVQDFSALNLGLGRGSLSRSPAQVRALRLLAARRSQNRSESGPQIADGSCEVSLSS